MNIETLKMPVHELAKGMQVVKLDRPWLETPFKMQGFRISSFKELRTLEKYCKFVYVELESGIAVPSGKGERVTLNEEGEAVAEHGRETIFEKTSARAKSGSQVSAAKVSTALPAPAVSYEIETPFEVELKVAVEVVEQTKASLKTFMQQVSIGTRNDLDPVREAASALEASVLRNPDPAMLIRSLPSDAPFSYRHCAHSAILGIAIARELGFRRQTIHELTMGILLADIGKIHVPKELLRTPRRLDSRETMIIQRHVPDGVEMARALDGLTPNTLQIIETHHERFNGSGYPAGLRGGEIPLLARIAGLVDSFDAITSERAYSEPIPIYEAVQEMYAATIDVFQRDLVETLIQVLGTYPVGSLVELSDASVAVVVALNRGRRLLPKVVRVSDVAKKPDLGRSIIDLSQQSRPAVTVKDVFDSGQDGIEPPTITTLAG